jgi:putative tricarboxylic transport membrane protein
VQPPSRADVGALVVTTILIGVGAIGLWQSREFSPLGAIFPRTICIVLMIAGGVTLWRTLRRRAPSSRGILNEGLVRGVLLIAVMSLWIALLERAGFVVAGVVAYVALALVTERAPPTWQRVLRFLLAAVILVVLFQLIFVMGLKVQLPRGWLPW